jgi:hypothetical protein
MQYLSKSLTMSVMVTGSQRWLTCQLHTCAVCLPQSRVVHTDRQVDVLPCFAALPAPVPRVWLAATTALVGASEGDLLQQPMARLLISSMAPNAENKRSRYACFDR